MPEINAPLPVLKTHKLFIGGKFPRSESGRTLAAKSPVTGHSLANYAHASRKDFRDAVRAARKAHPAWAGATAFLKSQILYRMAEMLQARASSLAEELQASTGGTPSTAQKEVAASIDQLIYFAGWADKYQQVYGSTNPISAPYFNFTTPEPTGVVVAICPDAPALVPFFSLMAASILTGNSLVILASEKTPLPAMSIAEMLLTSDLPAGVVNILTGLRAELVPHIATHMDVNAVVDASGDPQLKKAFQEAVAINLKRVAFHSLKEKEWFTEASRNPQRILDTIEFKTAWHPIGA